MANIISVANHKGGVGKTTSTINIGAVLASKGKKVLLIDLDAQANLTQSLKATELEESIYGVLTSKKKVEPYEVIENLYIIPSTIRLSGIDIELSSEAGREFILRECLNSIRDEFDYILIDNPPSLGLLTINAFTSSDYILIPLQAEYLALNGMTELLGVIKKVQNRLNEGLKLAGVFLTHYDHRKVLNKNIAETIKKDSKYKMLDTKIRPNIALAEAPIQGMDILRYNPKSHGAEDYTALTNEILTKF